VSEEIFGGTRRTSPIHNGPFF